MRRFAAKSISVPDSTQPLRRLASDKGAFIALVLLCIYAAFRSVLRAASRPFWFDEICTWIVMRQPSASALWGALRNGADGNPPLFYLIEKASSLLIGNQEIALRAPSIAAFICMLVCIFLFVRKRSGNLIALICAALPMIAVFYDPYAVEARPYMLEMAFLSIAMICYQHAPRVPWMGLMATVLALSQAVHYYTIFMIVPFGMAESILLLKTREIRWSVWVALVLGFLPLIPFWPLISNMGRVYGAHFWGDPSFFGTQDIYSWFLHIPYAFGIGIFIAVTVGLLALLFSGNEVAYSDAPSEEYVLLLSLIFLPFVVFLVTRITHGGLTERYLLPTALSIVLSTGYLLKQLNQRILMLLGIFLMCTIASGDGQFLRTQIRHPGRLSPQTASLETLLRSAGHEDLPVVVSNGLDYLPLTHYASGDLAQRLVVLIDIPGSIKYAGTDSVDRGLSILRDYAPLRAVDYGEFAPAHPDFLLYSANTNEFDWWPTRFLHDGDDLRLLASSHSGELYLVTLKKD
jgi:uncharacterized membrane protein